MSISHYADSGGSSKTSQTHYSRELTGGVTNSLLMGVLHVVSPIVSIIQLENVFHNLSLILAVVMNDATSVLKILMASLNSVAQLALDNVGL